MAFNVYPSVSFTEIDETATVPALVSTVGAIGGVFTWGPIGLATLIGTETQLIQTFGKPTNLNPETFFSAANFLAYSGSLFVSRAGDANTTTAVANTSALTQSNAFFTVNNINAFNALVSANGNYFAGQGAAFIARYPGAKGNSLAVSQCDDATEFASNLNLQNSYVSNTLGPAGSAANTATGITYAVGANTAQVTLVPANSTFTVNNVANLATLIATTALTNGDLLFAGNTTLGIQNLQISGIGNVQTNTTAAFFTLNFVNPYRLAANLTVSFLSRGWQFNPTFSIAPGQSPFQAAFGNTAANDQLHVVVYDKGGLFNGIPGTVLETYALVSRATDAINKNGTTNYYRNVINQQSKYMYSVDDRPSAVSNTANNLVSSLLLQPLTLPFIDGNDAGSEANIASADIINAYALFADPTQIDVSLIIGGKSDSAAVVPNWIISNVCEIRRDCVGFFSPRFSDVVNNVGNELASDTAFRNLLTTTTYGFLDSGYKYQYDKYNDVFRWIPLNGDIAGLSARVDRTRAPWFSPAGYNRGQIKNIVKLAYNPSTTDQAALYKVGVNAVVTQPGAGTILLDDQTLNGDQTSAFNQLGVRRLFIVLEKSIATVAKFDLFEFNDDFTRAQFVAIVTPFLQSVQNARGLSNPAGGPAYRVVADNTNNTDQVIANFQFVADIFVIPARAIRFIQLNFVAVNRTVQFTEVVGTF